jgi:hypothetical protein
MGRHLRWARYAEFVIEWLSPPYDVSFGVSMTKLGT